MQTEFMKFFNVFMRNSFVLGNLFFLFTVQAAGQDQAGQYLSQADTDLTIRKAAVLPSHDNVGGIYARAIDEELSRLVRSYHQWDLSELGAEATNVSTATELEQNVTTTKAFLKPLGADVFLVALINKTETTVSMRLDLFLKFDGKLFAQERLDNYPRFDIPELKTRLDEMFGRLIGKIPYAGLVLSRQQNNVTVNLGRKDGLHKGQVLTVFQLFKVARHPKFNFLVSTEKEILGKIKITKVDNDLSFGTIVSEKEKGTVRRLAKISNPNFVNYADPESLGDDNSTIESRSDKNVAFGKNPKEWVPAEPPSFGQLGLKLGLGTATASTNLSNPSGSGPGNVAAGTSIYPNISIFGELWLNPHWTVRADVLEAVLSARNPQGGGAGNLSSSVNRYSLEGGYNYLLHNNDFFGPKIEIRGGLSSYSFHIDDTSPRLLTSVSYTGLILGLYGSLPVSTDQRWTVGAGLNYIAFPHLVEKPVSSGNDPSNSIIEFTVAGEYKLRPNLNIISSLDFSSYRTDFGGGGGRPDGNVASSMSQRYTSLNGGIAYLF